MLKEETTARNLIVVSIIAILLGATFVPVVHGHLNKDNLKNTYTPVEDNSLTVSGQDEMVTIVTQKYGPHSVEEIPLQVSSEQAEEISRDLEALKEAIENYDKQEAFLLAAKLRQQGIFQDDTIFTLIENYIDQKFPFELENNVNLDNFTNLMCFVLGYGKGAVIYPAGLFLAITIYLSWIALHSNPIIMKYFEFLKDLYELNPNLATILFILFILSYFFIPSVLALFFGFPLLLIHWLPRLIFPFAWANIYSGSGIKTVGLLGIKTHVNTNIIFYGFIGFIINIGIIDNMSDASLFCLGFSPAVSEW